MRVPHAPLAVTEVLMPVLEEAPDREALVTASGRWTYSELDELADRVAGRLSEMGVAAGDRVAACLPNDVEVVAAFHGAMRLGAIWVGINAALAPPEKEYLLADSASKVYLAGPDQLAASPPRRAAVPALLAREEVGPGWAEALDAGLSERAWRARRSVELDPLAPAAIAYTSGTTGYPKGAVHSQHNLMVPGAAVVASRGYGPDLRKGDCLPLTILNMLVLTTLLVAQAGGCCVVMDRVEARGVADWVERERVTVWNGVPALLHTMVGDDGVRPEALGSLRELWVGGADCPESLRQAVQAKFGLALTHTYGLTEAPTIVTIDPPPAGGGDPHRVGASGRVLPHLDVLVLADDGHQVGDGEVGEVCVQAVEQGEWAGLYQLPLGYWNQPEASAELLAGDVLHTGDLGQLDEDGYLYLRDRRNLVILRGGANVYPAEVERVLSALPGVVAAAVTGVPDSRLGERVAAAVQLAEGVEPDEAGLAERCRAELAAYKVPERWCFVDSLARNSMGKVDRRSLAGLFE